MCETRSGADQVNARLQAHRRRRPHSGDTSRRHNGTRTVHLWSSRPLTTASAPPSTHPKELRDECTSSGRPARPARDADFAMSSEVNRAHGRAPLHTALRGDGAFDMRHAIFIGMTSKAYPGPTGSTSTTHPGGTASRSSSARGFAPRRMSCHRYRPLRRAG